MKRLYYLTLTLLMGVGFANAAVRDTNSPTRSTSERTTISRTATPSQSATEKRTTISRTAASRNTIARTATPTTNRTNTSARSATTARATKTTTAARSATSTPTTRTGNTNRSEKISAALGRAAKSATAARGTITLNTYDSITFGTGYNTCRDAYFTCMDQFCSTANDTYRRCICSSKLTEIQARERALSQASDQLTDFKNLNLSVIDKTAAEVTAMISASSGELTQSITKDTSNSTSQLSGISEVLSKTKKKSLSTQGTLDIAGDINSIWATTDLAGGVNIANLTGEALYNAVHAQCSAMVADKCPSESTQTMVVSAYGMYIENDCSLLIDTLDKKLTNANSGIRATEREMNLARLDTYNNHNSSSINNCIAQVRKDITADTACGADYVHCLDITGQYLNISTGQPIYSPIFYQLESQISLSGDVLTNQSNRLLVAELNRKRIFAERGLDTCHDIADAVWDEFLRQAITEIYQGQQERIRTVKTECLDVVNNCYDTQTQSLKDFSNVKDQLLLGSRLELSEEMCREKLDACSNLYGGGPNGLSELLVAMKNITSQQIANECAATLTEYAAEICSPNSSDSVHSYPYGCRAYAPGEQKYALIEQCNQLTENKLTTGTMGDTGAGEIMTPRPSPRNNYACEIADRKYTSCKPEYYLNRTENRCIKCLDGCSCPGGTAQMDCSTLDRFSYGDCGPDYVGSLYHKMVRYAKQACVRPSENQSDLPDTVLQDVNMVMDKIRTEMSASLATECNRLGGTWVNTVWIDRQSDCDTKCANDQNCVTDCTAANTTAQNDEAKPNSDKIHDLTGHTQHKKFYDETGANTKWGFCAADDTESQTTQTTGTSTGGGNSGGSGGGSNTPTLSCTTGETVTITLINTNKADCCTGGADSIDIKTQTISAICGEKPVWPTGTPRATCTTNPNCQLGIYSTLQYTIQAPAGLFFSSSDNTSATLAGYKTQTIYSFWYDSTSSE